MKFSNFLFLSCILFFRWMPWNPTDEKSKLVQVMVWCRQATSHYLSLCWPTSLSPYVVIRTHWVKTVEHTSNTVGVTEMPVYLNIAPKKLFWSKLWDKCSSILWSFNYKRIALHEIVRKCWCPDLPFWWSKITMIHFDFDTKAYLNKNQT